MSEYGDGGVDIPIPVDDKHCLGRPAGEVQACKPPLCPCTAVPNITGLDLVAAEKRCSNTTSGSSCTADCLFGRVTLGRFRCFAGSFIEVPNCMPAGGQATTLLGVHVSFRIQGRTFTTLTDAAYLEEFAPALRALIKGLLFPFSVSSSDISLRIRELGFAEVYNTASSSGRRLSTMNVVVSSTIAISSGKESDAELVMTKLINRPSASKLKQMINAEYDITCGDECLGGLIDNVKASNPQHTKVYVDLGIDSTTRPPSTTTPAPTTSSSAVVAAAQTPPQDDFSGAIVVSAILTMFLGMLCLAACVGVCWWRGRRIHTARVKPVAFNLDDDDITRTAIAWPEEAELDRKMKLEKRLQEKAQKKLAKEQEKQAKREAAEKKDAEKVAAKLAKEEENRLQSENAEKVKAENAASRREKWQRDKEAKEEAAKKRAADQAAMKLAKEQEKLAKEQEKLAQKAREAREAEILVQLKAEKAAAKRAADEKASKEAAEKRDAEAAAKLRKDQEQQSPAKTEEELLQEEKLAFAAKMMARAEAKDKEREEKKLKEKERLRETSQGASQSSSLLPDIEYKDQYGKRVEWTGDFWKKKEGDG